MTTTTAAEVLSLSDKGFFEACGFRAIDLVMEQAYADLGEESEPDVPGYITWLRESEFAELQELADAMANGNPAGVEVAVSDLTRLCAQAGYELPTAEP